MRPHLLPLKRPSSLSCLPITELLCLWASEAGEVAHVRVLPIELGNVQW